MDDIYAFGAFTLEVAERRLMRDGQAISLRPKVFDTLSALVTRHGRLVLKQEGFETADLKRARVLIGERASTPKQQRGRS